MWGQLTSVLFLYVCFSFPGLWFQTMREYVLFVPVSPILKRCFGCNYATINYLEILLGEPVSKFQKVWIVKVTYHTYQGCSEEI